jgi:hypothetical protein
MTAQEATGLAAFSITRESNLLVFKIALDCYFYKPKRHLVQRRLNEHNQRYRILSNTTKRHTVCSGHCLFLTGFSLGGRYLGVPDRRSGG